MESDDEKMTRAYVRMIIAEAGYESIYGPIPTFSRTAKAIGAAKDLAKAGVKQLGTNVAQIAASGILLPLVNIASPAKAKTWQDSFRKEIVKAEKRAFEGGRKAWGVVWDQLNVDNDAALLAMVVSPQAAITYLTGKVTFGALDILTGGIIKEKLGTKFEEVKKKAFEPLPSIDTADVSTKIQVAEQSSKIMRFLATYAGINGIISVLKIDDLQSFNYNSILNLRKKISEYMNLYTRTNFLVDSEQYRKEVTGLGKQLSSLKQGTPEYNLVKGKYQEALLNGYSEIIARLAVAADEYDKALKNLPVRDPVIEGYKKQVLAAKTLLSKVYNDIFIKARKIQTERPQLEKKVAQNEKNKPATEPTQNKPEENKPEENKPGAGSEPASQQPQGQEQATQTSQPAKPTTASAQMGAVRNFISQQPKGTQGTKPTK